MTPGDLPTVAVVVASAGRPDDLRQLFERLARQTAPADHIVVVVPTAADAPEAQPAAVTIVTGVRGAAAQRNAGVRMCAGTDLVLFLDDDFCPAPTYLAALRAAFAADPGLVAADGIVVRDGAGGPGLTWADADALLAEGSAPVWRASRLPRGLYGCNLAARGDALGAEPFDEALPLYSWLEDYDLSRRLARVGRLGRVADARGVHLGRRSGRTSGLRLGYSQIANPVYLARKGTMDVRDLVGHLLRRPAGNLWALLRRDTHVDRAGRLRGNLLAGRDLCLGRLHPGRILDL